MSETAISIYDKFDHPSQLQEFGKAICLSEMFGAKNASQGMILAMECAARRLPILAMAEKYHIIQGRLSMRSDAMLAGFRSRGGTHRVMIRNQDEAKIELTLDGKVEVFSLTWNEAVQEPFVYVGKESDVVVKLAKQQYDKLTIKAKYQTPRSRMQMMWARVVSDGVRTMAPEVVAGQYTPEEVADFEDHDIDHDDVVEVTVEPVKASKEEPVIPKEKPGVRLDGKADLYVVNDSDPCGEKTAEEIKRTAQALGMPPVKLKEIMSRTGAATLAAMPYREATKLLEKLKQRLSDDDIPF